MNLSDLRHFIRLSGLKPYISYSACDILYIKITKAYDSITGKISLEKIDFKAFTKTLIPRLGRLRYPKLTEKESTEKVFIEDIYPNIVTNLPYLYQYIPKSPNNHSWSINEAEEEKIEVIKDKVVNHNIKNQISVLKSLHITVDLEEEKSLVLKRFCL